MNLVNLPNGFRPTGADFLKREQNKADEFARLREQLGRGVAKGLHLTRQSSDGSVVLGAGHGADGGGNAIVVLRAATLDLSGVAKPQTGKFRWVAVTLKYKQTEQGTAAGVSGAWAEKTDGYEVALIEGAEAGTKAAAAKPTNATQALRVGDILFDDNGTRLAETSLADKPAWKTYADQKDGALETKLKTYADQKDGALETKLKTYADQAEQDAIETTKNLTNIGKTGNQPIVKFVASDWKDRPIGWRGMVGPGSAGTPDAKDYFYVEKVSNRNTANGYYWQAYPVGKNSYFYVGYSDNPATQNGGLPYWEKYESANKTIYSGRIHYYEDLSHATFKDVHGRAKGIVTIPIAGRYLVFGLVRLLLNKIISNGSFMGHWACNIPLNKPNSGIFGVNMMDSYYTGSSNFDTTVTNVVDCRVAANETLTSNVTVAMKGQIQISVISRICALKIGD